MEEWLASPGSKIENNSLQIQQGTGAGIDQWEEEEGQKYTQWIGKHNEGQKMTFSVQWERDALKNLIVLVYMGIH